jgi:hypothetical protein
MTKSYIVDPETGKLLTAQEWKDKAGDNVKSAKMVAIVPEDGTPFAFPVEVFDDCDWSAAMELAEAYKAPHDIEGSDGTFTLPTRKQGLDFRIARECGLEQLLEMIGADKLLLQLRNNWTWTREKYVPVGISEDRWSSVRNSATDAWRVNTNGFCYYYYVRLALTARPVTLLHLES